MIAAYLDQTTLYYSASKDSMIPIAGMDARHAANAAEKMIRDAQVWADDAGYQGLTPGVWVAGSPVVQALHARTMAGRKS